MKDNLWGRLWKSKELGSQQITNGDGTQQTVEGTGEQKLGADWGKIGDSTLDVGERLVDPAMTWMQQRAKKDSIRRRADILGAVPKTELPGVVHDIRGPQGLTYEQRQAQLGNIAGMRSQYKGSDPTMQLISKQMLGNTQLGARNQVAGQDAAMYRQDQNRYDQAKNQFNQQKFQRDANQAQLDNKYNVDHALVDAGEERELQGVRDETMDYARSVIDNSAKYSAAQDAMQAKNEIQQATDHLAFVRDFNARNATSSKYSEREAREALSTALANNKTRSYGAVRAGGLRGLFGGIKSNG